LKYRIDYPMRISRLAPTGGQILFLHLDVLDRQFAFEVIVYHLQQFQIELILHKLQT